MVCRVIKQVLKKSFSSCSFASSSFSTDCLAERGVWKGLVLHPPDSSDLLGGAEFSGSDMEGNEEDDEEDLLPSEKKARKADLKR